MPERMDYNHRGRLWGVDLGSRGSDGHDILRNIEDPVRHVAFIKVPKAASTTMGNIFLRFGDEMNLKFALPYNGSGGYVLTPKYFYLPPRNITYDIACAHAKYNRTDYDKYLHSDTKYIAIIREPFSHFQSYIRYMRPKNLLNISGENPVFKFLFLNTIRRNKTNRVDIICNSMARYLGFPSEIFFKKRNQTLIDNYIRKLETEIDFVMIVEFFDESIVMMRRLLHWELRHVLYSKLNVNKNIDARLKFGSNEGKLHKICADLEYRLYELFLRKWMDVLRRQSSDFYDEVAYFRKIRMKYENFCLFVKSQTKLNVSLTIEGSSWNKPFTVTEGDCMKHHMDFDKYSQILFKKQQTI
ncbi:galactose-3-O-sulfotransferase 3-like [Argopecten irradians]|uniref:galactose-3-O-sulfotransferase 3-like n=1 Tax=Argopecten irradians TaxID=31199 RepID=UPI0037240007